MRIFLLLAALAAALTLAACGGDDDNAGDALAVMYATKYIHDQDTPNQVEPRGAFAPEGEQDCLIPATDSAYVEGTCEWDVTEVPQGGWVAKFIETWKCEDFNAIAGNSDFCTGESGSRSWNYEIAPDGTTELFNQTGDQPPESLGAGAPNP